MIGSDHQYYVDGVHYFDCLYRIADINNAGFADIAIGCRERNEKTKETFWVYSIQKGVPKKLKFGKKDLSEKLRRLFVRETKVVLSAKNNANKLKYHILLSAIFVAFSKVQKALIYKSFIE